MKMNAVSVLAVFFLARAAFCGREVVFIGLSGEGAPAIEKTFNRLFQENLAVMPGVQAAGGEELTRLQARVNGFSYPAVTAPLLDELSRFASDTALVIWGMVKNCSIRPVRRFLIGAAIRGDLEVELTIFNLAGRNYVYAGDVKVSAELLKGFVFLRPPEIAVHISAADRAAIVDKMQSGAVSRGGDIIESVLLSEVSRKAKKEPPPAEEKKGEAKAIPVSADTTGSGGGGANPPDSANTVAPTDTAGADSTGENGTERKATKPKDSE